ncbi:MAG: (2Fe-2S)-binding protein [Bacilli bacterium]
MKMDNTICHCFQVDYITIRKAMAGGARSVKDIIDLTGAGSACGGCQNKIEEILTSACTCNSVSIEQVKQAIDEGANTVSEITAKTSAGGGCTRCHTLLNNIIENEK